MAECGVVALKPRERIISTARDLFRKHGIRGIGVDAIADAADTNKMTLYRHFGSKDDLVVACLRDVAGEADAIWNGFEQDYPGDPLAQLHAWVRVGAECVGDLDAVAAYAARQGGRAASPAGDQGPALTPELVGQAITSLVTGPGPDQDAYVLTAAGLHPLPVAVQS